MENTTFPMNESEAIALLSQMAGFSVPGAPGDNLSTKPATNGSEAGAEGSRKKAWRPDLRYRSLVEKLPVVTFMASLDETQQELYISPQIESLLGFTQEQWLEDPFLWFRQLHPDDREKWIQEFARTCATGANFRAEYRLLTRSGEIVWIQGECQIVRDDDGRPVFLQGVAFDISHIKRAAADLEARRAAQSANEAKSQFLARMSHEIRTPLNGVVGMIDLLKSTTMTDVQQRYVQLAREAADSLMKVINDILDFSKIEAGKVEIETTEFDVHKLVEDLTELLSSVAAKKKLALACLIRPNVPRRVLGDPSRIRQVLTNLVNNAVKFTSEGSVSIRVSLDAADAQGLTVRMEVQDTGIGIPSDRLDRLFKSFSQVDSSTTRKFGGTGLGLVISAQLVELMGGQIGVRSEQGKGTAFWFTLKLAPVMPGLAQSLDEPTEVLRNLRVLAVEPNPVYRRILTEQLEGRLSAASAVLDVDQAIAAMRHASAEAKPFSIALLPFGTPAGTRLAETIRSDALLRDMSLIALVDIDDRADIPTLNQAGFVACLHRPITQSRLFDTLASATFCNLPTSVVAPVMPEAPLKGLHLLVADDNEMNQFVTQETLRRADCTCDIVGDGLLAVQAAQNKKYDAILMDCQMPGMDGLEATHHIRQREAATASRRTPIIALTAEAIQGDREKCLAAGMDGYVTKPINTEELFHAIRSLLRMDPGAAQNGVPPTSPAPVPQPPPIAAAETPIDVDALLSRCMNDAAFAMQTLEKFRQRAIGDVELLRQGVAAGDIEKTTRLAHNLKSVAAHAAAAPLRKIAFEIEQAGARRDLQFITEQLAALEEQARRCAEFVPDAMKRLSGASEPASTKTA
jgi:Amt family ammonium transporter